MAETSEQDEPRRFRVPDLGTTAGEGGKLYVSPEQVKQLAEGFGGLKHMLGDFPSERMRAQLEQIGKVPQALQEGIGRLSEASREASYAADVISAHKAAFDLREQADSAVGANIVERMQQMGSILDAESPLAKAAMDIAAQQRALDRMDLSLGANYPPLRSFTFEPEDLVEPLGDRLERIEHQFGQALEIAKDSAKVATGLQASAVEFLQKFEAAAKDTNRSGKMAIGVALAAILITFAQTVSPYVLPDGETQALQESVTELQAEMSTMRAEQAATSQRLIDALAAGDRETAAAVRAAIEAAAVPSENVTPSAPSGQ